MEHQIQQHQHLSGRRSSPEQTNENVGSDTCSSGDSFVLRISRSNSESSCECQQNKKSSHKGQKSERQKKMKKGGKAKGTLETSVEIRNRMIGMSEAGLSTLSIALAIDRSVCQKSILLLLSFKLT